MAGRPRASRLKLPAKNPVQHFDGHTQYPLEKRMRLPVNGLDIGKGEGDLAGYRRLQNDHLIKHFLNSAYHGFVSIRDLNLDNRVIFLTHY